MAGYRQKPIHTYQISKPPGTLTLTVARYSNVNKTTQNLVANTVQRTTNLVIVAPPLEY